MHDAIEIEKLGVPAAAICTEPFVTSGRTMSRIGGIPEYPFAIIPHPVGGLRSEDLRQRAIHAAPRVLEILLANG